MYRIKNEREGKIGVVPFFLEKVKRAKYASANFASRHKKVCPEISELTFLLSARWGMSIYHFPVKNPNAQSSAHGRWVLWK